VYFGTTGNKWPYALGEKRFSNLADGDVIAYIDTGTIPDFVFYNTGLDALSSGEAYNLYTSSQTTTSSVVNLKIVTPGSTVGYSKGPTTTDTGTTPKFALSKGADPDADSNAYHLSVDWSVSGKWRAGIWLAGISGRHYSARSRRLHRIVGGKVA
jgi:hypothetical protein